MDLSKGFEFILKKMDISFTLKGAEVSYGKIADPRGLLPSLCKRADHLATLCFGYGLGLKIEEDEQATLGVKVGFDDYTPNVLRLLCLLDSLQELIMMSPSSKNVPLDELMYD